MEASTNPDFFNRESKANSGAGATEAHKTFIYKNKLGWFNSKLPRKVDKTFI